MGNQLALEIRVQRDRAGRREVGLVSAPNGPGGEFGQEGTKVVKIVRFRAVVGGSIVRLATARLQIGGNAVTILSGSISSKAAEAPSTVASCQDR